MAYDTILDPSGIAEIVKHGGCPMYAKLRYEGETAEKKRDWREAFRPLSPLLLREGKEFEEDVYESISDDKFSIIDTWSDYENQEKNDEKIYNAILKAENGVDSLLLQPHFAGEIGHFRVVGDSDVIYITTRDGVVNIDIYDIKASWEESTEHRIQVSIYAILFENLLEQNGYKNEYVINTGVITREEEFSVPRLENGSFSTFDRNSYVVDVRSLLEKDGLLHQTFEKQIENVPHQFDAKCHTCSNREHCFTKALEDLDIRLLSLTRGEQAALRKFGLQTIEDVAELANPIENPRPYDYDWPEIKDEYTEIVSKISEEHPVGERLPLLSQQAQEMLGYLSDKYVNVDVKPWLKWQVGSGDGNLPDDNPNANWKEPSTPTRGELIRVYLNIQKDYLQDSIYSLAGRVACSKSNVSAFQISETMTEIPETKQEKTSQERELLSNFFSDLFSAIKTMASMSGREDEAAIHVYFYTGTEEQNLVEAVKRYPDDETVSSVRDLLGMRGAIDQQMTTVIQSEVTNRLLPKTLQTGLLPIYNQINPSDRYKLSDNDWMVTRDTNERNLKDIFRYDVFDYLEKYTVKDDGVKFPFDGNGSEWYPLRGSFGAQIPLEYFWGCEEIDKLSPEWAENNQYKAIIEKYRWQNAAKQDYRISRKDIEALTEKFCQQLEAIERSIRYKNSDIAKPRIGLSHLSKFSIGEPTLASSCIEFLDLEYQSEKEDILSHYRTPVKQRVLSGESIPIEVSNAMVQDGLLTVEAELIYDRFDFNSPATVAKSCKKKESADTTSGSRMVATKLVKEGGVFKTDENPGQILHSTPLSIEELNTDSFTITLRGFPNSGSKGDRYRTWHNHFVVDAEEQDDFDTLFSPGDKFILDPSCDDSTAQRSLVALKNNEENTMYNAIASLKDGKDYDCQPIVDEEKLEKFLDIVRESERITPNKKQSEFIETVEHRFNVLQGPPGTGKTSGALAYALAGRVFAATSNTRALVTGTSNKAVDELLEDTADVVTHFGDEHDEFNNTRLVRLTGEKPEEGVDGVEYINYHTDEGSVEELRDILTADTEQTNISDYGSGKSSNIIIFSTPSRVYGLVEKFMSEIGMNIEDAYQQGIGLFDFFATDEASMQPLPQLFLSGAFIDNESDWQALIAGDHRQMPPVQRHEWKQETRRSIEEMAPFLSTLDYLRFVRGEAVEILEDNELVKSPSVHVPITRLEETFRCHSAVTNFLRRWIYNKDDIEYNSNQSKTINSINTGNDGVDSILSSEPMNLVMHSESSSEQSNYSEAAIVQSIISEIPSSLSVGVVTPHNSQKGLLESTLSRENVVIDTVERFQGGEKDVMIVSATVSDPDYIRDESEFILNPNRLTVALSRMKKKLIVVSPRTLFNIIPTDIDEYEDAEIWKGLRHEISDEVWTGSIGELLADADDGPLVESEEKITVFKSE